MTTTNIMLTKLTAADGMVLTNGTSYGKEVYLGVNDTADNWIEIQESEVPEQEQQNFEEPDLQEVIEKLEE